MKKNPAISVLFYIAALYDGLLGLLFIFGAGAVFKWFEVTSPNHFGYIHFPAALLIVFALMFLAIAKAPYKNINLIPYGILLKVSYCGVVGYHWVTTDVPGIWNNHVVSQWPSTTYHWITTGIPWIWKPFVVFDLIFFVLFIVSYIHLANRGTELDTNTEST